MQANEILSDFFSCQKLSEIHAQIGKLVKIALVSEEFNEAEDREKLLNFQEGLTECIDAAYQIAGK